MRARLRAGQDRADGAPPLLARQAGRTSRAAKPHAIEPEAADGGALGRFWLVGASALAGGASALALALALAGWPLPGLVLHVLGALGLGLAAARRAGVLAGAQAGALAFAFPGLGALGMGAWLGLPARRSGALAAQYQDFIAHATPRESGFRPFGDAREALRRELSVRPLADQLRQGTLATKQEAALALAAESSPGALGLLRAALTDEDGDTRLFSSLAILKAEERFAAELAEARARAADGGGVAALALARTARRYVESGLVTGMAARALWREIAGCAERVRAEAGLSSASAAEAWGLSARAALALDEREAALAASSEATAAAPDSEEAALLRCEALYRAGAYRRLPEAAAVLARLAVPHSPAAAAAEYWGGTDAP